MPHEPHNPTPDDWRDRLVDYALEETIGGNAPPDLSARILAAAGDAETLSTPGDLAMNAAPALRKFGARGWVLAASLLVNCGLLAMLFASSSNDGPMLVTDRMPDEATDTATTAPAAKPRDESAAAHDPAQITTDAYEVQLEQLPPTEEPPIAYPEAEVWEDLTARREKFAATPPPGPSIGLQGVIAGDDVARMMEAEAASTTASAEQGEGQQGDGANAEGLNVVSTATTDKLNLNALGSGDEFERSLDRSQPAGEVNGAALAAMPARPATTDFAFQSELGEPLARTLNLQFGDAGDLAGNNWGYYARTAQPWPSQPDQRWHGSPDGRGIGPGASGDQYDRIHENPFVQAIGGEAISTFSIDVDTASYANIRQMLMGGQVPPADAVRIEELVNYFKYDYEPPAADSETPFAAHVETACCPWQPEHRLVRIGIKGREVAAEKRPLSNLVFLVDISGSMNNPDKLPLVKHGLKKLAEQLGENDRVAIVVYASQEGLALPSTPGTEQETILAALDNLQSGGSTAGGAGITLAYQIAEDNFIEGGTNRVILCTDGDFNVGTTSTAELERLVEQKAKQTKVFLSAIGFGRGNLNDAMMEKITGIGNGNYYYADGEREAERIFVKGMTGMLVTIAKDVKIQVEFNPAKVAGYRLLGYENRMLRAQDFNDDKKDAGEIGAGHTVTCLYEIVPAGEPVEVAETDAPSIDELKYQQRASLTDAADADEILTLKMRYKEPDADTSTKLEWPVADTGQAFGEASRDLQFAAAVASFGMLLRDSQHKGQANYDAVLEIAGSSKGDDPDGERAEFVELVDAAKKLKPASDAKADSGNEE